VAPEAPVEALALVETMALAEMTARVVLAETMARVVLAGTMAPAAPEVPAAPSFPEPSSVAQLWLNWVTSSSAMRSGTGS